VSEPTLFDMDPVAAAEPESKLSDGRRRTLRQFAELLTGTHPVTHLPLHPDAPPADDRKAAGPRCGGCAFIVRNERDYLKCIQGRTGEIGTPTFRGGPYETHGAASDLRAWFPACLRFEPREPAETTGAA
jgi:hypothetical protein